MRQVETKPKMRLAEATVLLLLILAFTVIAVLHLAPEHLNSDVLMASIMSLQNVTLFYWGHNRILNLVPFIASWITDPAANLVFVMGLATLSHFALMLLFARIVLDLDPDPVPPFRLAVVFVALATLSIALFNTEHAFSLIVWQFVYPLPALIIFAMARGAALRSGTNWVWGMIWLPMLFLAVGLNFAVVLPALFLALLLALFSRPSRLRAALMTLGAVLSGLVWRRLSLELGSDSYATLDIGNFPSHLIVALRNLGDTFNPAALAGVAILLALAIATIHWKAGSLRAPAIVRGNAGLAMVAAGLFAGGWVLVFTANFWVQINEFHFRYFTFALYALFILVTFLLAWVLRSGGSAVVVVVLGASLGYWGSALARSSTAFADYHVFREADRIAPAPQRFYAGDYWVLWPMVFRDLMAGHEAYGLGYLAEGNREALIERVIVQEHGNITIACVSEQPVMCVRQAERVLGHVGDWGILSEQPELQLLELAFRPTEISYAGARFAALPSNAGRITEEGRQTDANAGCLFHGPYIPVPPGSYSLQVEGSSRSVSHARIDVTHQRGEIVLAEYPIPSDATGALVPDVRVAVPEGVHDLEIRLCVSEHDMLDVHGYSFSRVDPAH